MRMACCYANQPSQEGPHKGTGEQNIWSPGGCVLWMGVLSVSVWVSVHALVCCVVCECVCCVSMGVLCVICGCVYVCVSLVQYQCNNAHLSLPIRPEWRLSTSD